MIVFTIISDRELFPEFSEGYQLCRSTLLHLPRYALVEGEGERGRWKEGRVMGKKERQRGRSRGEGKKIKRTLNYAD